MNASSTSETVTTFDSSRAATDLNGQQMLLTENSVDHREQKSVWRVMPVLTAIWLAMVGIGLSWMWEYEATPGEVTLPLTSWPADSRIERQTDRPTLVVFAHPRCPCTRATIGELAIIMAHCPQRADVRVLFFKPLGSSAEWHKTDIWSSAETIPGVTVASDLDGSEAKRFCATTSGSSLLYSADGRLLFGGGITGSRGHSGDNAGRRAIELCLMNGNSDQKPQTLVFGCPLLAPESVCLAESQK